jgi:hypothetical protein
MRESISSDERFDKGADRLLARVLLRGFTTELFLGFEALRLWRSIIL